MGDLHVLVLGGTGEARDLAAQFSARPGFRVTLSLAGRTRQTAAADCGLRVGGFGGAEGLAAYLKAEGVGVLVDATHPFARRISANAVRAAEVARLSLVVLIRPAWTAEPGDQWTSVADMAGAAAALGADPRRVFLAIGRQEVAAFQSAPQHRYLVRSVEPVERGHLPPFAETMLARGPFAEADERRLLERHGIEVVVAKNSGGAATYAKIAAARALGLPVVMIERQPVAGVATVEEAASRIDHLAALAANRGV